MGNNMPSRLANKGIEAAERQSPITGGRSIYRVKDKEVAMAKDSQVDNKKARKKKADGKTPLTRENQNQSRNAKKRSNDNDDV